MRTVFKKMDTNHDGMLTLLELQEGFLKMGVKAPAEEARAVFANADMDGGGTLTYNEWATATVDK
jgi:Ca2+-binding EF-hand superfamily protein